MSRRAIEIDLIRNVVAGTARLSYFGVNSVIRSILSAFSFQIDETRYEIEQLRRKLFLLTAQGNDLEDLAASRGIERRTQAVHAGVVLHVGIDPNADLGMDDLVIPSGMKVISAEGVVFVTLASVAFRNPTEFGPQVDRVVEARAETPGLAGNIPSGSITQGVGGANIIGESLPEQPENLAELLTIANRAPGQGGREKQERDFELRYRAVHSIDQLNQGTSTFVEAQLLELQDEIRTIDGGARIRIGRILVERGLGATHNSVVVYVAHANGTASFTSDELEIMRMKLSERMPALVPVIMRNMRYENIRLSGTLVVGGSVDEQEVIRSLGNALVEYLDHSRWPFDRRIVGQSDLIAVIEQTRGVERIVPGTFRPASDIRIPRGYLPRLLSMNFSFRTAL